MNIEYQKWPTSSICMPGPDATNPWLRVFKLFLAKTRSKTKTLVAGILLGGLAFGVVSPLVPPTYEATTEIFIDPRGFGVNSNVVLDANAAINFVESQMRMISSDNVLAEVLRSERGDAAASEASPVREAINRVESWLGLKRDAAPDEKAAAQFALELELLKRSLEVTRLDRSFVVNVTVEHESRHKAAERANKIIETFLTEAVQSREAITQAALLSEATRQLGLAEAEYIEVAGALGKAHPDALRTSQKIEGLRRRLAGADKTAEVVRSEDDHKAASSRANVEGSLETAFLRVISPARPPIEASLLKRAIVWAVVGMVIGLLLAFAYVASCCVRATVEIFSAHPMGPGDPGETIPSYSAKR